MTTSLLTQDRECELCQQKRGAQIDVYGTIPLLYRHLLDGVSIVNGCAIDDDVQTAHAFLNALHGSRDCMNIPHIADERLYCNIEALLRDFVADSCTLMLIYIDTGNMAASLGQGVSGGFSQATSGSRN